jgi:hypothetical protein
MVLVSADNWARCPRCAREWEAQHAARQAEVAESYGKVSVEEFDQARADLKADRMAFNDQEPTFREDYEFSGAEEGVVTVSYRGQCTKCGLSLKIAEDHPIPGL